MLQNPLIVDKNNYDNDVNNGNNNNGYSDRKIIGNNNYNITDDLNSNDHIHKKFDNNFEKVDDVRNYIDV